MICYWGGFYRLVMHGLPVKAKQTTRPQCPEIQGIGPQSHAQASALTLILLWEIECEVRGRFDPENFSAVWIFHSATKHVEMVFCSTPKLKTNFGTLLRFCGIKNVALEYSFKKMGVRGDR